MFSNSDRIPQTSANNSHILSHSAVFFWFITYFSFSPPASREYNFYSNIESISSSIDYVFRLSLAVSIPLVFSSSSKYHTFIFIWGGQIGRFETSFATRCLFLIVLFHFFQLSRRLNEKLSLLFRQYMPFIIAPPFAAKELNNNTTCTYADRDFKELGSEIMSSCGSFIIIL